MQYARLGTSGLKVSRICLGMMSFGDLAHRAWQLGEEAGEPIVRRAVEAGVTFFDTADMYSGGAGEVVTGRLLHRMFTCRDDYVLATKVYYPMGEGPNDRGLSRKHIMAATRGRAGDDPVLPRPGVGVIPWSPLARGLLAGTWERGGGRRTVRSGGDTYGETLYDEGDFDVVDAVREVADGRGVPPAQVALAWLLGRPGVTAPAVGATRMGHLEDALAAVDLTLSEEEVARLEEPYRPHPVRGHS